MSNTAANRFYETAVEMALDTATRHDLFPGQNRHGDEEYFLKHSDRTVRLRIIKENTHSSAFSAFIAFRKSAPRNPKGWLLDYVMVPNDQCTLGIGGAAISSLPPTELEEERIALSLFGSLARPHFDMQPKSLTQKSQEFKNPDLVTGIWPQQTHGGSEN
ncbi:hypothetical protein [Ruegeria sp.]|uniref:hypothetical protein n=1 Tax=Ruegeria sp. TaxID=1879320 RepID=UPI003B5BA4B4